MNIALRWLKERMPHTLMGRSVLIIVVPVVLLQLVTIYVFFERHWDSVTRWLADSIAGDIAFMLEESSSLDTPSRRDLIFDRAFRTMNLQVSLIPDVRLEPADMRYSGVPWDRALIKALDDRLHRRFAVDTVSREREIIVKVETANGVLQFISPRKRLFSSTTYIFVLWIIGSAVLLFTVAMMFMRNQVRSIRRLAQAADSLGKGQDVPSFKPEGAIEVRRAADAFLRMRDRIDRQVQQRTEMLAGVSHDLRTPLTRMRLELEMLDDHPSAESLRTDVAEMQSMVEGYLAFARGEGGEAPVEADLAAIVGQVIERRDQNGATITMEPAGPVILPLRPNAIRRCVENLIGNAQRYGRTVAIAITKGEDNASVTVDDDGPGIPEDRREDVFRPFFRLDASRNLKTGGIGLGLTIARDVARAHGGDVVLESSERGGLRAELRLPL